MRSCVGLLGAAVLAAIGGWWVQAGFSLAGEAKKGAEDATVKRGEYLVTQVAHCANCHTPRDRKGGLDSSRHLQGTLLPMVPREKTASWVDKSPDITHSGLAGQWGEEGMVKFLTTGVNPDGESSMAPMPVFHLNKEDARAVARYLLSLPGKKGAKE
jgi:mono/diheme cytochrome c family protein